VRITKYDGLGVVATVFAGFMAWATFNAWDVIPQNYKLLGVVATIAAISAGLSMFTIDRGERPSHIGHMVFLLGLCMFIFVVYATLIIPDMVSRFQ
jgi:hypothetical protein